jgi:hypothetical protein
VSLIKFWQSEHEAGGISILFRYNVVQNNIALALPMSTIFAFFILQLILICTFSNMEGGYGINNLLIILTYEKTITQQYEGGI